MSDITIRAELRPCYVHKKKCLFHRWIVKAGQAYGLVEDEGGHVMRVLSHKIRFADGAVYGFCFLEGEE